MIVFFLFYRLSSVSDICTLKFSKMNQVIIHRLTHTQEKNKIIIIIVIGIIYYSFFYKQKPIFIKIKDKNYSLRNFQLSECC